VGWCWGAVAELAVAEFDDAPDTVDSVGEVDGHER
jgi:hypothetical protein